MKRKEAILILGVNSDSLNEEEVRNAYRTLAAKHHPDRGGDPKSFARLQEAYELLSVAPSDAEKKSRIEQAFVDPEWLPGAPPRYEPKEESIQPSDEGFNDLIVIVVGWGIVLIVGWTVTTWLGF